MNTEMSSITDRLAANKLSLNVKKTNFIIFTKGNMNIYDAGIFIRGTAIQRVYNTKFLLVGVITDSKLNWQDHIKYVSNKLT